MRVGVHVVEGAEQLLLRVLVAAGAVAADADADRARAAALALRLPDGVQDALAHALEVAVGAAEVRQFDRHRILRVAVLAAAALEQQPHLDVVAVPLLEVDDRRSGAEVVAGVLAGDGVHRVRPELAATGRLGDGVADLLGHPRLVGAGRRLDLEGRHAGVLADGAFALGGHVDVLGDDGERLGRLGAGRLRPHRGLHRGAHVGWEVRRRLDDEVEHGIEESWQHVGEYNPNQKGSGIAGIRGQEQGCGCRDRMGQGMGVAVRRTGAVAALICMMAAVAVGQTPAQQERHARRLFQPQDLGQLEGPDRDLWQKPEQIMDALGIADRSVVADLGAGGGWFTIRLARRVGPQGIVYAEDVQQEMLDATSRRAAEGRADATCGRCSARPPTRGCPAPVDAVLIVDTYHEMDDPVKLLGNLRRALKPSGPRRHRGLPEGRVRPRAARSRIAIDPEVIVRDAEAAGLRLLRRETFLPYQFLLVFGPSQATSSAR